MCSREMTKVSTQCGICVICNCFPMRGVIYISTSLFCLHNVTPFLAVDHHLTTFPVFWNSQRRNHVARNGKIRHVRFCKIFSKKAREEARQNLAVKKQGASTVHRRRPHRHAFIGEKGTSSTSTQTQCGAYISWDRRRMRL